MKEETIQGHQTVRRGRRAPVCAGALLLLAGVAAGCQDEIPTATDPGLVPISPLTVEVLLPAEEFIREVQVVRGFGIVSALPDSLMEVARGYTSQDFEARTLVRFPPYPTSAVVRDSTGATVTDTELTYLDGALVLNLDTLGTEFSDSLRVGVSALDQPWDAQTATWDLAVDSLGNQVPWAEPGAGPARPVGQATWRPAETADTLRIPIDSATIAEWGDTTNTGRGVRIEALDDGTRMRMRSFQLRVNALPSSNPDTVVSLPVQVLLIQRLEGRTFIYRPEPADSDSSVFRVGGAPAYRTYLRVDVPRTLTGPPELCAEITCPLELDPELINSAQILLTSRSSPEAFRPLDTTFVRPQEVREPDRIPRTPLGRVLAFPDVPLPPGAFADQTGVLLEVPFTVFVQNLLNGPMEGEAPPTDAVVLLSPFEPSRLGFASFGGLGTSDAPVLRMILTVGDRVGFR